MDESVKEPEQEKTNTTFLDDAVSCFAKNLFTEQEEMKGRAERPAEYCSSSKPPQMPLKPHQSWYEGKNYTREEIEAIVKEDVKKAGFGDADPVYAASQKKDRMVDNGCPLLNNLDQLWCQIGEVFTEYQTANPDRLTSLLAMKCPKCDIKWEAGGNLVVNGATTNITHGDVKTAFNGLKKLVSDKTADQILASIIAKKIQKLF